MGLNPGLVHLNFSHTITSNVTMFARKEPNRIWKNRYLKGGEM